MDDRTTRDGLTDRLRRDLLFAPFVLGAGAVGVIATTIVVPNVALAAIGTKGVLTAVVVSIGSVAAIVRFDIARRLTREFQDTDDTARD